MPPRAACTAWCRTGRRPANPTPRIVGAARAPELLREIQTRPGSVDAAPRGVFGLDCVGLRYTNVFGPGEESKSSMASILWQIVTAVAARRPVRLFDDTLTAARDYLPVQVLVSTLVRLLDTPQVAGVYNLGSGTAIRFETLLGWCTEWAGAPVPLVGVPNPIRDRYQYWTCADMRRLRAALPGLEPVDTEVIHRYARDLFDHARAETFGVGELVKSL